MDQIGIFGGTFDPIHLGHLIPAEYACNHFRLKRLILVPSASPVHRPRHVPAAGEHRLRMCRLAAASIPSFEASDIEVSSPEPSYTVLTLRELASRFCRDAQLILLVGADNLSTLHTWYHIREILSLAKVAVLPRPGEEGYDLAGLEAALGHDGAAAILGRRVPAPLVPISASQVRGMCAAGRPITGLVPGSVARYIAEAGLYRDAGGGP
ncbi:MAG: nicotinate (nicotinamide) nucleotide adenylyltransferase [Acidobacteria bacterium]|nr:nicotinate (nicotinamide) nucleotide adenylyltransferase [Acidobacteriota bacterium]